MFCWALEGVFNRGGDITQFKLGRFPILLGRHNGAECIIPGNKTSRKHALINQVGKALVITDLNSSNGTYVNHIKISEPTSITDGDEIKLGDATFRLVKSWFVQEAAGSVAGQKVHIPQEVTQRQAAAPHNQLEELIEKKQVTSLFQPVYRGRNMQVIGYELLTSGNNPKLPSRPLHLFYLAESHGLAPALSEVMRNQGVAAAMVGGLRGNLLVNAHPWELADIDRLLMSLHSLRSRFSQVQLTLEIQEHAVKGDIDILRDLKKALAKMRISLAFRDFGVCDSRILDLLDAKPNLIKFDKALVEDIDTADHPRINLIDHYLALFQRLNIKTLAERVGTQAEFETCKNMGFDYFQGYYLAKPEAVETLARNTQEYIV